MHVVGVQEVWQHSQLRSVSSEVTERRSCRFLHHVAKLAGENHLMLSARKQGGFDEEHVAPRLGTGHAGGY